MKHTLTYLDPKEWKQRYYKGCHKGGRSPESEIPDIENHMNHSLD
jgi:hypothetical protein